MKLTVLYLGNKGAGAIYSLEMCKALLIFENVKLQIVLSKGVDNIKSWQELKKNKNVEFLFVETYVSKIGLLLCYLNLFKTYNISRQIKKYKPDIVYAPMISLLNPFIYYFIGNLKIFTTIHDPILHSGEKSYFIDWISNFCIKRSSKIILLNNFFEEFMKSKFKLNSENIVIIPHASFYFNKVELNNLKIVNKYLFLGRIEKYKGVDLLLDAHIKAIKQKSDLKLTIAGSGNLNSFSSKINEINEKSIEIINKWLSDEEVIELLNSHDFVVLPYLDATQSGVIPLAFSNQRTVIATEVGALAEQVPLNCGILVSRQSESISRAILKLYSDENRILELGLAAYRYANENLKWEKSAAKLIESI